MFYGLIVVNVVIGGYVLPQLIYPFLQVGDVDFSTGNSLFVREGSNRVGFGPVLGALQHGSFTLFCACHVLFPATRIHLCWTSSDVLSPTKQTKNRAAPLGVAALS